MSFSRTQNVGNQRKSPADDVKDDDDDDYDGGNSGDGNGD